MKLRRMLDNSDLKGSTVGAALRGRPFHNNTCGPKNGRPRRAAPTVDPLGLNYRAYAAVSFLRRKGEVLVEEFGAGFEEVVGGDDAD